VINGSLELNEHFLPLERHRFSRLGYRRELDNAQLVETSSGSSDRSLVKEISREWPALPNLLCRPHLVDVQAVPDRKR
jgi:hypothetical protein